MDKTLASAVAAALGIASASSHAVMLNPRGTGQVLIYPYYTVNNQQTLVSVANTTAHGKALKLRFREGYDGREVAGFNVYLAAYDSWVGAVYDTSADGTGAAAIATNDNSCTVPSFASNVPGGPPVALAFRNASYSQGAYGAPSGTDHGPTGLARTREGFFEIIEMGEIVDSPTGSRGTLSAITPFGENPPGCAQVQEAWLDGGYWTIDAAVDLQPPAGGLYGSASIVDVAQGTLYAYDATAIDGFSDVVQNTAPSDPRPNLSTAVTDSAHDIASAYLPIGNAMVKADYPASTRGVDAVSAVLLAAELIGEFDSEPEIGAHTEFVVTFPTKQFYVDPSSTADSISPFETRFDGDSCHGSESRYYDREGDTPPGTIILGGLEPPPGTNYLCYETTLITFNDEDVMPGVPSTIFSSRLALNVPTDYSAGRIELLFPDSDQRLRASLSGQMFFGVPAVGFAATNYINANVTPGVLSNYSGATPLRRPMPQCAYAMQPGPCP